MKIMGAMACSLEREVVVAEGRKEGPKDREKDACNRLKEGPKVMVRSRVVCMESGFPDAGKSC